MSTFIDSPTSDIALAKRLGTFGLFMEYVRRGSHSFALDGRDTTGADFLLSLQALGGQSAIEHLVMPSDRDPARIDEIGTYKSLTPTERMALDLVREQKNMDGHNNTSLTGKEPGFTKSRNLYRRAAIAAGVIGAGTFLTPVVQSVANAESTNSSMAAPEATPSISKAPKEGGQGFNEKMLYLAGLGLMAAGGGLFMAASQFKQLAEDEQRKVVKEIQVTAQRAMNEAQRIAKEVKLERKILQLSITGTAWVKVADLLRSYTDCPAWVDYHRPEPDSDGVKPPGTFTGVTIYNPGLGAEKAIEEQKIRNGLQGLGMDITPDANGDFHITQDPKTWLPALIDALATQSVAKTYEKTQGAHTTRQHLELARTLLSQDLDPFLGPSVAPRP